jgi:hypothetical protein
MSSQRPPSDLITAIRCLGNRVRSAGRFTTIKSPHHADDHASAGLYYSCSGWGWR